MRADADAPTVHEQLPLLTYREPTRLRASARDNHLVLEARGADREEALDAMVACLNHLDARGVPVLAVIAGAARFPVDLGRAYRFTYPLVTAARATDAAAMADAWWRARGGAA